MKKIILRLSIVTFTMGLLAFCVVSYFGAERASAKDKPIVCRLGSVAPATSAWGTVAKDFKKRIEEASDGRLDIQLFLGGQLGSEASMLQMVQMGTIEGAAVTVSAVAKIVPEMNIYELPFLFHDIDEARTITDYVIYPSLNEKLGEKKLFGSAMFENGFRNFITKKFIKTPSDLKGKLKFASEESKIHIAFWNSLGAAAVPKPATELFVSLTRRVVDGADNSILAIYALNLFTKTKRITESEHIYQAAIIVCNKDWWDSLPNDIRNTLLEHNLALAREMRVVTYSEIENVKRGLGATGVKFYKLTDEEKEPFIKKTKPVYKEFEGVVGKKLLKQVLDARETYRSMKAEGKSKEEIIEKIKVKM
ncbi:MAG: TRAP transporter substrate-binding protein [bacterium]